MKIKNVKGSLKISVVTISYNQKDFLEECILSVLKQDYQNIEYIIVDAGSTDGSRELINKYKDNFSEIIFEKDDGPADGLNKGFGFCTGDVLTYLNADDRFMNNSFKFVNEFFSNNPSVDVLNGAIRIIDKFGDASFRKRISDEFELKKYAARICTIGQQATFFRMEAFKKANGFNPDNRIAWDGELLVDMALTGANFKAVNKLLGDFRIYSESITGSNRHYQSWLDDHERISNKIKSNGVKVYKNKEAAIHRVLYKVNFLRHIMYYLVR